MKRAVKVLFVCLFFHKSAPFAHKKKWRWNVVKMFLWRKFIFSEMRARCATHTDSHDSRTQKTMQNLLPDENFPISSVFQHLEELKGVGKNREKREIA